MNRIEVDVMGSDAVARQLALAPKEMEKAIKAAMKKSAKEPLKKVKSSLPKSEWNKQLSVKAVVKRRKTEIQLSAGIFGKPRGGNEIPAWFKAYWMNYGTLTGRDTSHPFKYGIKRRRRKNNVGQPAKRFFELATNSAAQQIAEAVKEAALNCASKLEEKINGQ